MNGIAQRVCHNCIKTIDKALLYDFPFSITCHFPGRSAGVKQVANKGSDEYWFHYLFRDCNGPRYSKIIVMVCTAVI